MFAPPFPYCQYSTERELVKNSQVPPRVLHGTHPDTRTMGRKLKVALAIISGERYYPKDTTMPLLLKPRRWVSGTGLVFHVCRQLEKYSNQGRQGDRMAKHSHRFVEDFDGFLGYGMDRHSDENTVQVFLQKFSDDALMQTVLKRMSDDDLSELFEIISKLLKKYLSEPEYHQLFLKDSEQ